MSLEFKAKRFVRGADLPPLERHLAWKGLAVARRALAVASRRGGRRRSAGAVSRPLCRDRGGGAPGAAPGRRPRDLPGRRPAGENRPREHGAFARDAGALSRSEVAELALALPRRARVRGLSKKRLLRARCRARCCRARSSHGGKQGFSAPVAAWLRGAMESFARDVLATRDASPPGLLRSGRDRCGLLDRPRATGGGSQPPDLGAPGADAVDGVRRPGAAGAAHRLRLPLRRRLAG